MVIDREKQVEEEEARSEKREAEDEKRQRLDGTRVTSQTVCSLSWKRNGKERSRPVRRERESETPLSFSLVPFALTHEMPCNKRGAGPRLAAHSL